MCQQNSAEGKTFTILCFSKTLYIRKRIKACIFCENRENVDSAKLIKFFAFSYIYILWHIKQMSTKNCEKIYSEYIFLSSALYALLCIKKGYSSHNTHTHTYIFLCKWTTQAHSVFRSALEPTATRRRLKDEKNSTSSK